MAAKQDITHSLNAFVLDLSKKCQESQKEGNLAFSPLSINVALGMLYAAAAKSSAAEIAKSLHLPSGKEGCIHDVLEDATRDLKKDDKIDLHSANGIFIQENLDVRQEYLELLQKNYAAELKKVQFFDDIQGSCKIINNWVSENTFQKIKDIVSPQMLGQMTKLVLVNAVYFKGNWASPFKHQHTKPEDFHLSSNSTVKVEMMSQKSGFRHGKLPDLKCQALEIPYTGNKTVMFILLPDDVDGIDALETSIKVSDIEELPSKLHYDDDVILSLPKFKVEHTIALKPLLSQLGINEVFTTSADLSGLSSSQKLYVSSAMHKCFVQVDEEGTVAAAATSIGIALMCYRLPTKFVVDHPFLFLIYNLESNVILFMGSIRKP